MVGPDLGVLLSVLKGLDVVVDDCMLEAVREVFSRDPNTTQGSLTWLDLLFVPKHLLFLHDISASVHHVIFVSDSQAVSPSFSWR